MRVTRLGVTGLLSVMVVVAACDNSKGSTGPNYTLANPDSLTYQLAFGDSRSAVDPEGIPPGVILSWIPPADSNVAAYIVFGRDSTNTNASWYTRAITTSSTFHDAAPVQLQYYVASQDIYGDQSSGTPPITINFADSVQTPGDVRGTAYNGAVTVGWDSIAQVGVNASRFEYYRVYSEPATATSDSTATCDSTAVSLEGTTVSTAFVITGLPNGVFTCYGVTSVSQSGLESQFSPFIALEPEASDSTFTADKVVAGTRVVVEQRRRLKGRVLHGALHAVVGASAR